jgi:hypothetical protein
VGVLLVMYGGFGPFLGGKVRNTIRAAREARNQQLLVQQPVEGPGRQAAPALPGCRVGIGHSGDTGTAAALWKELQWIRIFRTAFGS